MYTYIIGLSLSEPYLVHCMAEVPVVMDVCLYVCMCVCTLTRLMFDVPACCNFVCNGVHIISSTHLDGLASLSGTLYRVWARAHFKGAA